MKEFLSGYYTLGELKPEQRLDALFEFLKALPDKAKRSEVYSIFPKMSKYQVDRVLRILDFSGILRIRYGVVEKRPLAKEIERRGRLRLEDFVEAPDWVIRTLKRGVVIREIEIGDDTSTGYTIYYDYLRRVYVLRDSRGARIKTFNDLGMVLTFSLETEGHETLVCEMASWTWVNRMHPDNFGAVEDVLATFMSAVLRVYFGFVVSDVAIKGGLEYMSEPGTYISEEVPAEFYVDKIMWDDAKCVIEYIHEKKYVEEGVIKYRPIRRGKIEITLKEFRTRHPEIMQKIRGKEVQKTLRFSLKVKK